MPKTLSWSDGTTWTIDEPTFQRVIEQLRGVDSVILGLKPIVDRWATLANEKDRVDVDSIAPSENDRGVLSAGLDRAVEETERAGASALGFEDPKNFAEFLGHLIELHRLFATDITYKLKPVRG